MAKKLEIKYNTDEYECDDCGTSYATGAEVYLDGKLIIDKKASAHCYEGSGEIELAGILLIALEKMGVEVTEEGEVDTDFDWYRDTCYEYDLVNDGQGSHDIVYKKL
jgi:hypothetical protein